MWVKLVFKVFFLICVWHVCLTVARDVVLRAAEPHVFSHTLRWEERQWSYTKELAQFDVVIGCHGNRFRTNDHSTVSREQHNEILFNSQMQLPDDTRGVHDRVVQDIIGAKGDADKCGADGPMLSTS